MLQKQINSGFFIIFEFMQSVKPETVTKRSVTFPSASLERNVSVDFYFPPDFENASLPVLLINDGQDLDKMRFEPILNQLYRSEAIQTLLCVGIHAGLQRKLEYGTAGSPDYKGRGKQAAQYTYFILEELIPAIKDLFSGRIFSEWAFAGFSLGGLSALDIAWNYPELFRTTGVFSGSLWWRSREKEDPIYSDTMHRLMHAQIQKGAYKPGMKFFFECGTLDEKEDRNQNGVIDSIDDTKDLIRELIQKGYVAEKEIHYLEIRDGTHDVATWALAMPHFLKWAWGK